MNKKNYITLANKAANIQINELKKIKKIFNNSFIKAVDLILIVKVKLFLLVLENQVLLLEKFQLLFQV